MVIDSSAIIAILLGETEAKAFSFAISEAKIKLMSTFSVLESSIVIESKKGEMGKCELDFFIFKAGIETVPFDKSQMETAITAWGKYGKGRHPAGLNIGDCCSYALSIVSGEPMLFKGDDFNKTDITIALE